MRALFLLPVLALSGCINDPASSPAPAPPSSARGVYILNEGGFNQGNSTLSYYDPLTGQVANDLFAVVNGRPLGDVGNSVQIRGEHAYIVVNNSHKIEIIAIADHRSTGTIDMGAGRSPRQLAFIDDSVALVTNLYDDSVIPVDVKNRLLLPRIPVGPNPEGIAIAAGKAFVANSGAGGGRTVAVIDLALMAVVDTLEVGDNPTEVQVSGEGEVYVLCVGSWFPETPAKIVVIDPHLPAVVDSISFGGHVYEFALASTSRGYIPVGDSVLVLDTGTRTVTGTLLRGTSFYSVGVDPVSGNVYAGNARNYVQPGSVSIYTPAGTLLRSFDVGITPGSFAFRR